MEESQWTQMHACILALEKEGVVTRTFRRLDPERQQAVTDAILEEAVEKGPAALNIKHVARRAGVSVGALYTYFPNREGLLAYVVALGMRHLTDLMAEFRGYLSELSLRDALTYYLAGGVEWGKTQMGLMRFFARAAYHGDTALTETLVRPVADLLRITVFDMLALARSRGEVREDVDLEATARVLHALLLAVGDAQLLPYLNTYFQICAPTLSPEQTLQALVTMVLQGVTKSQ
ncbi:MAG: TetR/AcrR family transcriptional regulator [Anaerolineae bacterium]|nr:TetR/AcrR family transcriptional regulator [Anaerolineae bacterium]